MLLAAIVPSASAKIALLTLSGVIPLSSLRVCRRKYFSIEGRSRAGAGWATAARLMATAWLVNLALATVLAFAVGGPVSLASAMRPIYEELIEATERASAAILVIPSIAASAVLFFLSAIAREQGAERTARPDVANRLDFLRGVLVVASFGLFCTLVSHLLPRSVENLKASFGMLAILASLMLCVALFLLAHRFVGMLIEEPERPWEGDPDEVPAGG